MRTIEDLLREQKFFQGLDPHHLSILAGCGANTHFAKDQAIYKEGDTANYFYIIRSGKVAIEVYVPNSGPVGIEMLSANSILGASWLFPPYRWHFDARAVEPVSAISLDATCLRGKCDKDPALGYELMKRFATIVAQRLENTRLRLTDIYANPAARGERVQ